MSSDFTIGGINVFLSGRFSGKEKLSADFIFVIYPPVNIWIKMAPKLPIVGASAILGANIK